MRKIYKKKNLWEGFWSKLPSQLCKWYTELFLFASRMSAQAPFFPIIALCVHTHAWNVECLLHAADIYGWMGNYLFTYGKDFGLIYHYNYANDIQNYSLLHLECLHRPFFQLLPFVWMHMHERLRINCMQQISISITEWGTIYLSMGRILG